jgi:L-lactate dehydrogenase
MKIGIVGAGFVGATAAYAMMMRGVGRRLVLIDVNKERARAEADDIQHAGPFAHPISVEPGEYSDLDDARAVVITAGVSQRPGETRMDLLGRNAAIMTDIVENVVRYAPDAVLVIATNPVDVMTHLAAQVAGRKGWPAGRVIGTGTMLDTARFRTLLARYLGVDSRHIHAYVLGEHGDSEVLAWSLVNVGGIPLEDYCRNQGLDVCAEDRQTIDEQVRQAAYAIIAGKGATYYGVGSAIANLVDVILRDQRSILTVSGPHERIGSVENVTLSLPHLVGGAGMLNTLDAPLTDDEAQALEASARTIREAIDELPA